MISKYFLPFYRLSFNFVDNVLWCTNFLHFDEDELAFCCGSHAGENCHVEIAERMLKKIGLNENYLKCGIHEPLSRTMQNLMLIKGEKSRRRARKADRNAPPLRNHK